jgi:ribonuclease Z
MPDASPRIDNAPYRSLRHGGLTIEGWSRAGVQTCWRIPELRIGIDLGAIPWDFTPTATWFVSHGHLDHMLALPALLGRRGMLNLPPPTVFVPVEIIADVQALLSAWRALDRSAMQCQLVGLAAGDTARISGRHHVTAFATAHPVPSRGYIVWERRQKLKDTFVGMTGEQLKALRDSGTELTAEVTIPLICYTGDTGPVGLDGDPAVYDARVLIVEMSFARAEHSRERIHAFGHLHLDDFVERADRFRNELIVAGHVTTRDDPAHFQRLVDEKLPAGLRERVRVWGAD